MTYIGRANIVKENFKWLVYFNTSVNIREPLKDGNNHGSEEGHYSLYGNQHLPQIKRV